jgi:hypothetical protein
VRWPSRRVAIAAVIAVGALLLILWQATRRSDVERAAVAPAAAEHPRASLRPPLTPPAGMIPDGLRPSTNQPPIIDEVTVEKTEVCDGEDTIVTVRARAPDPRDDRYLEYQVGGQPGPVAVVNWWKEAPPERVWVKGRDGALAEADLPRVVVKDCEPSRRLFLSSRELANADATYLFAARVVNATATTPMQPVRYRWSFGDGNTVETDVPHVEHTFDMRGDSMYSHFVVTCEAIAADGERVRGRRSFDIMNLEALNLANYGVIVPRWAFLPRYPVTGDDGVVGVAVRLWHGGPHALELERVVLTVEDLPEDAERPVARAEQVLSPQLLLGTTRLPASGISFDLAMDTRAEPQIFGMHYEVYGRSSEGWPVYVRFSLLRPRPPPTRDRHAPVDPVFAAKVRKAQELLGKQLVNQDEIWTLEETGAFAGIAVPGSYAMPIRDESWGPAAGQPIELAGDRGIPMRP